MKIVIAPDSFKESLSADKCCQAIKAGFSTVFPDARYVCLPIADGGKSKRILWPDRRRQNGNY